MRHFVVEYTVTEVTRQRISILADSAQEALEAVEGYEFDNTDQYEVNSLMWSISSAEVIPT